MFGYIKTDYPNLYVKDTVLYKSMYCGLCKGIKSVCGQRARLTLNYDLTFLSVLLHNVINIDVEIEKQHCIIHPIRKVPIAKVDDLTKQIGALNVILAYHKLNDDVLDESKGKFKRALVKKGYNKALKDYKNLDDIVSKYYAKLLKLEKENCDSIDIVSDPFASMIKCLVKEIVGSGEDKNLLDLSYNLGKWIYLIDAIDDFDKDIKNGNYNVFSLSFNGFTFKEDLLKEKGREIEGIFGVILSDIFEKSKQIKYNFNHDLLNNVFQYGLIKQTKQIMENVKCKNTTKF